MASTKVDQLQGPLATENSLCHQIFLFASLCTLLSTFHPWKGQKNSQSVRLYLYLYVPMPEMADQVVLAMLSDSPL